VTCSSVCASPVASRTSAAKPRACTPSAASWVAIASARSWLRGEKGDGEALRAEAARCGGAEPRPGADDRDGGHEHRVPVRAAQVTRWVVEDEARGGRRSGAPRV
jgi:hypothetical protein